MSNIRPQIRDIAKRMFEQSDKWKYFTSWVGQSEQTELKNVEYTNSHGEKIRFIVNMRDSQTATVVMQYVISGKDIKNQQLTSDEQNTIFKVIDDQWISKYERIELNSIVAILE